ncbi:MAG: sugar phosphate isomerase/epimerase [Clostridia bacterium]|nr:sugar phosphate isomerase/epimerase [Clostridia bacterium]
MEIGISTASLFTRENNEDAVKTLDELGAKVTEVFLETFPEYEEEFAKLLKSRMGNLKAHSVHVYTMHYEPELFSDWDRSYKVAEGTFRKVLSSANILGADHYTLHGKARIKKKGNYDDYKSVGERLDKLSHIAGEYGVKLCLENVEWSYYNRVGFFKEVKKYAPDLKGVLDIKQARLSGQSYREYIEEMGEDIETVHLSDIDQSGRIRLPGKGLFDFKDLFERLSFVGFRGNMLIEVYAGDYGEKEELVESLEYLRELKEKFFIREK